MLKTALCAVRRFAASLPFAIVNLVLASVFWCIEENVYGVLAFALLLSLLLILCDDTSVTLLPFLLTCMLSLRCYDSFDTFMAFAPLAVLPIGALILHFTVYRKPFSRGRSLYGLLAVTVAVTLGGLFTIPVDQYFSGTALFYVFGLGLGMVAAYFLLRSRYTESDDYNLRDRVLAAFYIAALFGFVMLLQYIVTSFVTVQKVGIVVQWSNNLATLLMFFLPAPFYYALKKNRLHLLMAVLIYLAILLTGSRGGFLMGSVEFFLCFLYIAYYDRPSRVVFLSLVTAGAITLMVTVKSWLPLMNSFISTSEPRYRLMLRAFEDFAGNPIFGMGFGYQGNTDIYNPVKGAANWYHMMLFQIIGSFGTVGILAYGYQLWGRMKLIFQKVTLSSLALGLSYSGVFLMSMVNPGEFCPIPYQLLAVLLFILLENPENPHRQNAFLSLRSKEKA